MHGRILRRNNILGWILSLRVLCEANLVSSGSPSPLAGDDGGMTPSSSTSSSRRRPCGIWMAPSTLDGAGLGTFAGRAYSSGEYLQPVGDVLVPIVNLLKHAQRYNSSKTWLDPFRNYVWDHGPLDMGSNDPDASIDVLAFGLGAAINCFYDLNNVHEGRAVHDMTGLRIYTDPGAGGFSPFFDRRGTAKSEIQAGSELFTNYGSHWFRIRPDLPAVPGTGDLDEATDLVRRLFDLETNVPFPHVFELWEYFVNKSPWRDRSSIFGAFRHKEPRDELKQIQNRSLWEIRSQQSQRSLEWLEQHGICGDYITPHPSTLPQAGRGAFATRTIPANTTVAHLPLIHVTDRNMFNMYNLSKANDNTSSTNDITGYQLLLNYCFGHRESSLLLCNYGIMAGFVNHNKTLANVKIQWAEPTLGQHTPALLNQSIEYLEGVLTPKLAFDLVTLFEIKEGEEILMDYGSEWEHAWQKHVADWEPLPTAYGLNSDHTRPLLTAAHAMNGTTYSSDLTVTCDKSFIQSKNC